MKWVVALSLFGHLALGADSSEAILHLLPSNSEYPFKVVKQFDGPETILTPAKPVKDSDPQVAETRMQLVKKCQEWRDRLLERLETRKSRHQIVTDCSISGANFAGVPIHTGIIPDFSKVGRWRYKAHSRLEILID